MTEQLDPRNTFDKFWKEAIEKIFKEPDLVQLMGNKKDE